LDWNEAESKLTKILGRKIGPVFADGRDMGLNVGQPPDGVDVDG
jgi:hypothetical protein